MIYKNDIILLNLYIRGVFVCERRRTFVRPNGQIWTNVNVNVKVNVNVWTNVNVNEATQVTPKRNEDEDKHDPYPKKRTKTNVGKHWPNILQNTQKYPKNTQKCPKNAQNERKKRKKRRKIVIIWTNVNVNVKVNVNVWTNVNVNKDTYVTPKQNEDEVEEALKFL